MGKRVLDVGQCSPDHMAIRRLLEKFDASIERAESIKQAFDMIRSDDFDLVLINRIFDATGESGEELIRLLKSSPELKGIPVMLVSNFEQAQERAVQLGALPGFGKASLALSTTTERLKVVLGS